MIAGALSGVVSAARAQGPEPCLSPPRDLAIGRPLLFSREPGRILTPLERIPAPIRARLDSRSIYVAAEGRASSPWRVVIMRDGQAEIARGERGARYTALAPQGTTQVGSHVMHDLVLIADRAWREPRAPNRNPNPDYDEVLAMRDGDAAYFARGFGPLRGGAAEELVARVCQLIYCARPSAPP